MSEPVFISDEVFLHHINKLNIRHLRNFLPAGGAFATPASLDIEYLIANNVKIDRIESAKFQKRIYFLTKQELLFGLDTHWGSHASPRLEQLIHASMFRNNKKVGQVDLSSSKPKRQKDGWIELGLETFWSDDKPETEQEILKTSEIEIEFELARRKYAANAPSRITCLFMVEDNPDGRDFLCKIYNNSKIRWHSPLLLELGIIQEDRLLKVDSNWYTLYNKEYREEYLSNYWHCKATNNPEWEILFEGMVLLRNNDQKILLQTSHDALLGLSNSTE